jgi:anti-anti-sigma factor
MIDLGKTALHRVYRTEAIRQTLVVNLQGDSPGFSAGAVQTEMMTLLGVARHPEVRNLIIDMSNNNYFGSVVLGEIVKLGQAIRERGGRVALCGLSQDMQEILRIMKLDTMWERYPTRASAVQAVAGLTWGYRLKPFVKPIAIVAAVLALVAVFASIPRKDPVREDYLEFAALWEEAKGLRDSNATESDWLRFSKKANKRIQAALDRLPTVKENFVAAVSLMDAAGEFDPAVERHLRAPEHVELVDYYLARAQALLNDQPPPWPPKSLKKSGTDADGNQKPAPESQPSAPTEKLESDPKSP